MARKNVIEAWGTVEEVLSSRLFRVRMPNDHRLLGHRAGKMRDENIPILPEDKVLLEISPYDLSKGRIIGIQSKIELTEGGKSPRLSADADPSAPLTQQ